MEAGKLLGQVLRIFIDTVAANYRKRLFGIDTTCPRCKTPLRLIALIKTDDTIKKILSAMGLPTCAPKLWPARPPPSESGGEGGGWLN
jgi:hypothetical protein